jgi:hypothetical protein
MSSSETRQMPVVVGVRFTEEAVEQLTAHAEAHGKTLPALIRLLLARHLDRCAKGTS